MNNNMNGVRRLLRPRMRGFTLGGFRFRFGIVFHALQHPVQVLWYYYGAEYIHFIIQINLS